MDEAVTVLTILTEVAPLVLAIIILAGVLLFVLWIVVKVAVPALRETVAMFETQRQSWQAMVDEQRKYLTRIAAELKAEIEEQEKRIEALTAELKVKEKAMAEMSGQIAELKAENAAKTKIIDKLRVELEKVKEDREKVAKERDELLEEVKALRNEVRALREEKGEKTT